MGTNPVRDLPGVALKKIPRYMGANPVRDLPGVEEEFKFKRHPGRGATGPFIHHNFGNDSKSLFSNRMYKPLF